MAERDWSAARHGKTLYLTLDFDAVELLHEMTPAPKAQGRFLSELLRAEKSRREEREKMRQELLQVLA